MHLRNSKKSIPQGLKAKELGRLMSGLKPGPTRPQSSHADTSARTYPTAASPNRPLEADLPTELHIPVSRRRHNGTIRRKGRRRTRTVVVIQKTGLGRLQHIVQQSIRSSKVGMIERIPCSQLQLQGNSLIHPDILVYARIERAPILPTQGIAPHSRILRV